MNNELNINEVNLNNKENSNMKDIKDMTLDELMEHGAMLFECGAEITTMKSAYESEAEFQSELAEVTAELDAVEALINFKTNQKETKPMPELPRTSPEFIHNNKENNMNKCCAITKGGQACKGRFLSNFDVMVKGGVMIDPSLVREGNMVGWYFKTVMVCKTHNGMLLRGQKVDLQKPVQLVIEEPKEEVKTIKKVVFTPKVKTIKCGKFGHEHHSIQEVKDCYAGRFITSIGKKVQGASGPVKTIKRVSCGNCSTFQKPVYHDSIADVKACYAKNTK